MPTTRSGRRVPAARPLSQKQPSTRHDGLGNDVKGERVWPQATESFVASQGPNKNGWSYGALFLHRVRSMTPSATRVVLCPGRLAATGLD